MQRNPSFNNKIDIKNTILKQFIQQLNQKQQKHTLTNCKF